MDLGPHHLRRVVCDLCPRVLQDGNGPTFWGRCEPCQERETRRQKRERRAMERRKLARPALTAAEIAELDEDVVFAGFMEEDAGE